MNWNTLQPSTWNLFITLDKFGQDGAAGQVLADLFILIIVYVAGFFALWSLLVALYCFIRTRIYFFGLPPRKRKEEFVDKRRDWTDSKWRPLASEFNAMLVEVPVGADSFEKDLKRVGEASEVFNERTLAHGLIGNRLFMAMPGILTGLGVLGTFLGLQFGIGSLELDGDALEDLDKSIKPLIKGSSIAFSTSVWGVGCSIVFAIIEKLIEGGARRPIRTLQRRLNGLVPRYCPEEGLLEIERHGAESEKILKGLAAAIGEHMQQAIARVGTSISEAVRDALGGRLRIWGLRAQSSFPRL